MKKGVKQKVRDYFIILNLICACFIYIIATTGRGRTRRNLAYRNCSRYKLNEDYTKQRSDSNYTKILIWTSYFGEYNLEALKIDQENCPAKCQFSFDKSHCAVSDGIIFHARDIDRDGWNRGLPSYHPQSQIWIFLLQESPDNTHLDLNNYPNVFNWTMTYRLDSDIYHPYGRFIRKYSTNTKRDSSRVYKTKSTLNSLPSEDNNFIIKNEVNPYTHSDNELGFNEEGVYHISHLSSASKYSQESKRLFQRPKIVAWVVSNCHTSSNREGFVTELMEYLDIDVYGKCGVFICPGKTSSECYSHLGKMYKFYLAFENSLCVDYVTEKFFDALLYGIVPVVYGNADYSQVAPKGSFINARDFSNAKELAEYILYLNSHHEEYLKFFNWKKLYKTVPGDGWCSLCVKLRNFSTSKNKSIVKTKSYSDIYTWWNNIPNFSHKPETFSTSAKAFNKHEPSLISTLFPKSSANKESSTQDNQYHTHSLKASGIAETGMHQSACLNAPIFTSPSWYSKVLKYFVIT